MADQTLKDFTTDLESSSRQGQSGSMSDTAAGTARDLKDRAAQIAQESGDTLRRQASGLADQAKDLGSQAADKLQEEFSDRRNSGAEYVGNIAETIRRAAGEFDGQLPIAATYIRKAAEQVDVLSGALRAGDLQDVVRSTQDFARRQPTVFLGLSLLAGFGLVRFLKSSSDGSRAETGYGSGQSRTTYGAGQSGSGYGRSDYGSSADQSGSIGRTTRDYTSATTGEGYGVDRPR